MTEILIKASRPAALAALVLALALPAGALAQQQDESGWLGVVLQDVTGSVAQALGLQQPEGALISSVREDSPAAEAGLREGDVVVSFNRHRVEDSSDLAEMVHAAPAGRRVRLGIVRDGEQMTVSVRLGSRPTGGEGEESMMTPSQPEQAPMMPERPEQRTFRMYEQGKGGFLGVQLQDVGKQLGNYFGIENGQGALVQEVVPDSPAAEAGLEAGDVIVAVGSHDVAGANDVREQLAEMEPGEQVEVHVIRDRRPETFDVTLGEPQGTEMPMARMPRVYRLPEPETPGGSALPSTPYEFWFGQQEKDQAQLQAQMRDLRRQLRDLRRELRDLEQEMRAARR